MVVELTARPHITAGVALAAASVITIAPATHHVPDFRLAHQLSHVSISDIQLTDAAGTMMDLFSGVESELASLASGSVAADVPTDIFAGVVNPAQTWINTFETAGSNLQTLYNQFSQLPFPTLQQVGANAAQYGTSYVSAFQKAANNGVNYFLGSKATDFVPIIAKAWTSLLKGNISTATSQLLTAFYSDPIINVGEPLEAILRIPVAMSQNFANFVNSFLTYAPLLVVNPAFSIIGDPINAAGASLQAAYTAWNAGETLGSISDLVDMPGQMANALINTAILNSRQGLAPEALITLPKLIAGSMVTSGAQNITGGGSLSAGIQSFLTSATNGWPAMNTITTGLNYVGGQLTVALQNIPSVLAGLPAQLGGALGSLATHLGSLVLAILKML
ncbi:hypothetical protein BST29_22385 [Mycobacterium malmoense]|uniref:PE-PGRS family protein n=1 Tax=Mycobacterium malmoense TaxID=1780 RepID=A0ABX3SKZ8_MYCMA|nr:hypothetical protein BST29_22385 [Mycobacterium malmoense]